MNRPTLWDVLRWHWQSLAFFVALIVTITLEALAGWLFTVILDFLLAVPFLCLSLLYALRSTYHRGAADALDYVIKQAKIEDGTGRPPSV